MQLCQRQIPSIWHDDCILIIICIWVVVMMIMIILSSHVIKYDREKLKKPITVFYTYLLDYWCFVDALICMCLNEWRAPRNELGKMSMTACFVWKMMIRFNTSPMHTWTSGIVLNSSGDSERGLKQRTVPDGTSTCMPCAKNKRRTPLSLFFLDMMMVCLQNSYASLLLSFFVCREHHYYHTHI